MPDLRRWFLAAFWPAYPGHCVHATVGALIAFALQAASPVLLIIILATVSIGHELYDDDLMHYPLNGLCDVLAFWPVALMVLPLSWVFPAAALLAYGIAMVAYGRQVSP